MKRKMTVGTKFALTSGALMMLSVLLGAAALYGLGSLEGTVRSLVDDPVEGLVRITAVRGGLLELRGNIWRHIGTADPAARMKLETTFTALQKTVEDGLAAYEKTIFTPEDRDLFSKIGPAYREYARAIQAPLQLSRAGKNREAQVILAQVDERFRTAIDAVNAELDLQQKNAGIYAATADRNYSRARWTLWIMLSVCLTAGVLAVFVIVRSMNVVLRQALNELSESAEQVASAANQVSASSQSLAEGSSEQAASLEETSASSEQINAMALKNSENSRTAADLVTSSQQKFEETNHSLEQMIVAMGEINAHSDKISKIIKVIDEIAFQTNILALNAAVEAARAGEAGMGFAVVADEVRNLAQRCAQAAKDTSDLIEESIAKSHDGKGKVDRVAAAIRAVTGDASKVKILVDEVSAGSQEQSTGIGQVARAIVQMQQVTQNTAASAEEGAAAAEQLSGQSAALKEIVERLTALVGSHSADSRDWNHAREKAHAHL